MWYRTHHLALAVAGPGITKQQAQQKALAAVGGGTVKSESEAHEAGKVVYQFDINVKGKGDVERVRIDESSGKVIGETYHGSQTRMSG